MGKIQKMVDYAVAVAKDDSHGYSQARRWPSQGTDFDCSSLMYQAACEAGYNVPTGEGRYTGTMLADFTRAGFKAVQFDGDLSDLEPGDIMLNVECHTEMYVGGGKFAGAHIAETGRTDGKPGDQTGNEISLCPAYIYDDGWDYVLVPPAEVEKTSASALGFTDGTYYVTASKVGIRSRRATASELCCTVAKGMKMKLKAFAVNSAGNVWAEIASGDHKGRFVMAMKANGTKRFKKA